MLQSQKNQLQRSNYMFLKNLRKILFYPKPLSLPIRRYLVDLLEKFSLQKIIPYEIRLNYDWVARPWYGYSILHAAKMAKSLGYKSISIIEFGVAEGNGLVNIEKHIEEIKKFINIEFEVYGFDMGTGLPKPTSDKDLGYHWQEGFFRMDQEALKKKLKLSKLVLGDVKDTCPTFFSSYNPAPISCVFVDLDYYSSTVEALKIFDVDSSKLLPRVYCYFDDILGSEDELYNEYSGELAAINHFNETHKDKKICKLRCLFERKVRRGWNEMIYSFHNFSHAKYNKFISDIPQRQPLEP